MIVYVLIGLAVLALIVAAMSVRIVKQYERVVQFRLGKVRGGRRPKRSLRPQIAECAAVIPVLPPGATP